MFGFKILYSQQKYNFISKKHLYLKEKVMITLRGMAEESYINVFNYQCLTLLLYRYKYVDSYFPLIPFLSFLLSPSYMVNKYDDSLDRLHKCKFVF